MYKGKPQNGKILIGTILVISMFFANAVWALPKDGKVVAGLSTISQPNSTTTYINQTTDKSIINWPGYSIGAGETVRYFQPGSSSISLNRVTGSDPSLIYGQLLANGQVWVINPNGLLVGKDAKINVGSFLGSTLDINNDDFLNGRYKFINSSGGLSSVTNQGNINAAAGGYVVFLSPSITNEGNINTNSGKTYFASGDEITVNFAGNDLISFTIDKATVENALGIKNTGIIIANGGEIILSAKVAGDILKTVVNNEGIIQAQTIENKDGVIKLLGGMENNAVSIGGTLDASAPNGGNGGFIETSAASVKVNDGAKITTAAPQGTSGNWLIDPYDFTIAASGGDVTGSELGTALGLGNVTIQTTDTGVSCTGVSCGSGTAAGNGDIFVNDNITWSANTLTLNAYRNIEINSELFGSGTASLALLYGQGAVAFSNTASYTVNAPINLPEGNHFSTTLGSDGSTINYYVITSLGDAGSTTGTDLQGINGNLSGYYALGSNINASATSTWNSGLGFAPVGDSTNKFTGRFDGLGHTISNLTINRPSQYYVGLFGYIGSGSTVSNVGLEGVSVCGYIVVGGLVGYNYTTSSSISNSYATGSVSGTTNVGGLVGINNGTVADSYATGNVTGKTVIGGLVGQNSGSITNSYATGSVSSSAINYANTYVGGLVGYNNYGIISNSYAMGNVSGFQYIGGLVGYNYTLSSSISNSYATGSVSGNQYIGGLIGGNYNSGTVSTCYASGSVTGNFDVGGFAGYNGGTISASYWDTITSGTSTGIASGTNSGATGLTTAQMMDSSNFSSWTFGTAPSSGTWFMIDGNTRPFLQMEYSTNIVNAHQLQLMAMDLGASYTLGANIDMAELTNPSSMWGTQSATILTGITTGFSPIGSSSTPFTGTFDGLGHTISNLNINRTSQNDVGLFGYIGSGSTVSNVGLAGGSVSGYIYVGWLAGQVDGTVINVHATGNISGIDDVGGLVGVNHGTGTISNSYATGSVSGSYWVGGLVADNYGTVTNAYATGNIIGGSGDSFGGLVGRNYTGGSIINAYATGSVSGYQMVGGLVGSTYTGSSIENSYATGNVSGSKVVGGLVGSNSSLISNVYATGNVEATGSVSNMSSNYVGGLVGNNSGGTVSNAYATGNVSATGIVSGSYFGHGSIYVGGLVGLNSSSGSISNSYAAGSVLATGSVTGSGSSGYYGSIYVGGLVGLNSSSSISNSYAIDSVSATGNVSGSGSYYVGGFVGRNSSSGSINNSYATGNVSGSGSGSYYIGGLVGTNGGTVTNSFWDTITTGQTTSAGGTGKITSEMMTKSTFTNAGWDFTSNTGWWMSDGNTRPFLRMEYSTTITNAHQLQLMAMNLGASYTLGANISMAELTNPSGMWGTQSATVLTGITTEFVPIGNDTTPFTGTFNGQNYTITNLAINRPSENYVGLFGYIGSGITVSNVGLVDGSVSGNTGIGGLVGYNLGTVENSYATGSVTGVYYVGGLAGYNGGTVNNSYATGSASGNSFVGGLAGYNGGTVGNSHATDSVTGEYYIGGLAGYNGGTVDNSYATNSVTGNSGIGGLVGYNGGTVNNSYATNSVTGEYYIGGLTGVNFSTVENSHATGIANGNSIVGGLAGYNGGTVNNSYATNSVTGEYYIGGLAGYNLGTVENSYAAGGSAGGNMIIGGLTGYNLGTITNSYATSSATGEYYVGGLVGINFGDIYYSYATGSVSGSTFVGGLLGYNDCSVTSSFWDTVTTGQASSAGGTGKTDAEMKTAATFIGAGWSTAIWNIVDGSYATLK